jgi:hypothetical protein
MTQSRAKDIEEKEESRRHKKAPQPVYDQRKQVAEAEDGRASPADAVLNLQQTYGNRYVQRVMGKVQAKLIVNPPDDVYEKEADRVADTVSKSPASSVRRQAGKEEEVTTKRASAIQRQAEPEEEEEEEEETIQTKAVGSRAMEVSEGLEAGINAARGGGQSLPSSVRSSLEPQLGQDFSQVHIHTDARADKLSQQLDAKAFTSRNDVFFREGAYQPGSDSGRGLIAHELTHVVQQGTARVSRQAAETEQAAAESKEEAQEELKNDVDKIKPFREPKYVKDMLRITAECKAQGIGESSYKWAMEETAEAASTVMKGKTAALDAKSAKKEMTDELIKILEDVVKRGGDAEAVESVLKEALDRAKAQMEAATKNLKPGSTRAKAKDVAAKAAQVQLLGGDATKAVEAVKKWEEEEPGKEGKPGKVK